MLALAERQTPLALDRVRFLSQRFQKLDGCEAAPGAAGTYAVVRQDGAVLGLVAVDDELGIWYTPHAEDQAELRRQGFSYSRGNVLASLYFDLPFAAAAGHRPPAARPATAAAAALPPPLRLPRLAERVSAGALADPRWQRRPDVGEPGAEEIEAALAHAV